MDRIGLVLEGGGMRGAYTAGALAWLKDHGVTFDYYVGISSGAIYLSCYVQDRMDTAYRMAVDYAADDNIVGLKAFKREGYYVAYRYMFDEFLKKRERFSVQPIKDSDVDMEIGCYDLEQGKTIYFKKDDLDDDLDLLRAACALPIASETVEFKGHKLLDGGITKMIPIERSLERGCTKHLVITTKPADYVRKPASGFMKWWMSRAYKEYPQEARDYAIRHLNYNHQVKIVNDLVEQGTGYLVRPSRTIKVSRFKGDKQQLLELYELGYQDMEAQKEELGRFLGRKFL